MLDLINAELQILAQEEVQSKIDLEWEEMMQELYQLWELEQYAEDAANADAEFYGVM